MAEQPLGSIRNNFSKLEDPRIDWQKLRLLKENSAQGDLQSNCSRRGWDENYFFKPFSETYSNLSMTD